MGIYYYILFYLFVILAILIVLDRNVGIYIDLMFRYGIIQIKRLIWLIRFHPYNLITKWISNRKIEKMVKQFEENLDSETKNFTNKE